MESRVMWTCGRLGTREEVMSRVLVSALVLLASVVWRCQATELMFELPDRDRQCFYEEIEKEVSCTLEYQVGFKTTQ